MTITADQAFDLAQHVNAAKDEARKKEANKIFRDTVAKINKGIELISREGGYSACVTHMSADQLNVYESRAVSYTHLTLPTNREV